MVAVWVKFKNLVNLVTVPERKNEDETTTRKSDPGNRFTKILL